MKEFKSYFKEDPKPKKDKKPLKRTRIKYKKKDTGLMDVLTEIASEREWACWTSGVKLWQLKPTQFLHVLAKGLNKYPHFRCKKENIILASDEVHFAWDHEPRSKLKEIPMYDKLFRLEEELKEEYRQLYGKK